MTRHSMWLISWNQEKVSVIAGQLMQLFIPLDAICSCTSAHATFKYRVIKTSVHLMITVHQVHRDFLITLYKDAYVYEVYICLKSM
jgi:hypothetical protein